LQTTPSTTKQPLTPVVTAPTTKVPSKTSTPVHGATHVPSPGSASTIAYSPTIVCGDHGKAKPSRRESLLALQTK